MTHCNHVFTRGKNKDTLCNKINCSKHESYSIPKFCEPFYIENNEKETDEKTEHIFCNENVYNTILEMIKTRGLTLKSVKKNEIQTDKVLFIYTHMFKVNVNFIKNCIIDVYDKDYNHVIIVYKQNITTSVKKIIDMSDYIYFETFKEDELYYNVLKHDLVPEHTICNDVNYLIFYK